MYTSLIRPLLFRLPAEKAHNVTFKSLKAGMHLPGMASAMRKKYVLEDPRLERELFGLKFPNPVGLAAGLDKNAELVDELANFGFGFIEIGTLTPKGQPGNPQPRLFRLPQDKGLINRMGFNNEGVHAAVERLRKRKSRILIGGNIGKNKSTDNNAAADDYRYCFEALYQTVDYFVVNVSSPNTPNLRDLQDKEPLRNILLRIQEVNHGHPHPKPVLLKIAPDLSRPQLDDILELAEETHLSGLIATNTTIKREPLSTSKSRIDAIGAGGLSGKPLGKRSTEVIRYLHRNSGGNLPIIGVGGIFSAEDALEKLEAGASLVQLYTGFVYEGPALVRKINEAILRQQDLK